MREIEFREIFRAKCPNCGCKNKVHSELMDEDNKFKGYSLKCCNCGKYTEYLLDVENNGIPHMSYRVGFQSCIQPSYCKYSGTECKLPKYKDKKIEPISPLPSNENINRNSTVTEYVHTERFL